MYGMISTWRMALEGTEIGIKLLKENAASGDALETAIKTVEDFEYYKSVGYGGLPNEEMQVELDASYMDGDTLNFGAVGALKDFANPISVAKRLSELEANNFLVGEGAAKFASKEGFERKNMLTERAKIHYHNRLKTQETELRPYIGHDTVGAVSLDQNGTVTAGTSTSGLFMKKPGRVGDSPIIGSGFYADSEIGGASATGMGEDLMKGLASYNIVRLMGEGLAPQAACEQVVHALDQKLKERRGKAGDLSVIALGADGQFGAASNIEEFSFVVATENHPLTVYLVTRIKNGKCQLEEASQEWMDAYMDKRMAPLKSE